MTPTAPLTFLTPAWVRDLARADLVRQAPGDDAIARADAMIDAAVRAIGLTAAWYLDTETGEGQVFADQGVGALIGWPADVVSYLFHPGAHVFLDGGELEIGVVRDSTLLETNDSEFFAETFEEAAFVGVDSLKITNTVCVSGNSNAGNPYECTDFAVGS
jgi:hypothetical protein